MAVSTGCGLQVDNVEKTQISKEKDCNLPVSCNDIEILKKLLKDGQLKQVKEIIRNNHWCIDDPIRRELWPLLCSYHGKEKFLEGFYEETLHEILGSNDLPSSLPSFVDPSYCMNYFLNRDGKKKIMRVVTAVCRTHPEIVYSPLIYPLSSLLGHYMNEEDIFYCISNLITSNNKDFISQTKNTHEEKSYVMQKLTKKFAKAAYNQLESQIKENETIQKVFLKWQWWIFKGLPFHFLIRIMDCFLLDGYKALYRMALAILVLYTKHLGNIKVEFDGGIIERIVEFCSNIPVSVDKFIKIAYGFRRLSGTVVNQLLLKAQMTIKSQQIKRVRSASLDFVRISESSSRLETSSLDIVIDNKTEDETISGGIAPLGKFISDILSHEQITTLWNWLPSRITILSPQLVYSSNEHGCCLTAFFMKVDSWEPTILIVKTNNNEIFGAYCSSDWADRHKQDNKGNRQLYFGTGESFLFSFSPKPIKYCWIGIEENEGRLTPAQQLFMSASNTMICVGSGEGQGLCLDESLTFGRTETCATFNNEPLCSTKDFTCTCVEVFGFK